MVDDKHSTLITLEQLERNKLIVQGAEEIESSFQFNNLYMQIMDWKNKKGLEMPLMEIIVDFCEEMGYDSMDVGEELKKDKQFIKIFKNDLHNNHQIRLILDEHNDINQTSVDDWF